MDIKIVGITLLMMGCLMAFSLGIDVFQGFDISQAFYNALSPFQVMEVTELFVLFFLVFLFCTESVYLFIKEKREEKANKDSCKNP